MSMNSLEIEVTGTFMEQDSFCDIDICQTQSISEIRYLIAEQWNADHLDSDDPESVICEETSEGLIIEVSDWGDVPGALQSLDNDLFELGEHYADSNHDLDVFEAAQSLGIQFSDIDEAYQGKYRDDKDFAQEMAEQLGAVDEDAKWPMNCIDWEYAAKELMYDYAEAGGHYFRNM